MGSVYHEAFMRLRELGQAEALGGDNPGVYWPSAAVVWEPSLKRSCPFRTT